MPHSYYIILYIKLSITMRDSLGLALPVARGVVNSGLGNSAGWGKGPTALGCLLYAISQHDTAIARATKANSAVSTSMIINPIFETHTFSSPHEPVRRSMRDSVLLSMVRIALDYTMISSPNCPV